jgi:selenocysteine lyase/cysteine desulfurase
MVTPNPACVRQEIQTHRQGFDANPALYFRNKDHYAKLNLDALGRYLGTSPNLIALTESTTAGLSVVLNGLRLGPGDEVVSSQHEHYSVDQTLHWLARSRGIRHKRIELYQLPCTATRDGMCAALLGSISEATRVVCLTWVHSCTGVKVPLRELANAIAAINVQRPEEKRILTVVDAVHGLGVEIFPSVAALGGDFVVSGLHKWMFGPRGTGFVWGSEWAWSRFKFPLIVSFDNEAFYPWRYADHEDETCPPARMASPGGFPAFEQRWAIHRAVEFMEDLGQAHIDQRLRQHLDSFRRCLAGLDRVHCATPEAPELSGGMLCFEVRGVPAQTVVEALLQRGLITGQTPYRDSRVRIAPSIVNSDEEIAYATRTLEEYLHGL